MCSFARWIFFIFLISVSQLSADSFLESIPSTLNRTDTFRALISAFKKVMLNLEDVQRLEEALLSDPINTTERDHILEVARLSDIKSFMHELNGRLDGTRKALSLEERKIQAGGGSPAHQAALKASYRRERLTPEELALVIFFYKTLDSKKNILIEKHGFLKRETEIARQANEATAWPIIEIRRHEEQRARAPYSDEIKKLWIGYFKYFRSLNLVLEFRQLWSQMVNFEAGHLKYRHLDTFEERFLLDVRRYALEENQHFAARDLILSYLSSTKTGKRFESQLSLFVSRDDSLDGDSSLSWFAYRLSEIRDRPTLQKFFEEGLFLNGAFEESSSVLVKRVLETYSKAHGEEISSPGKKADCIKRIKILSKS